MTALSKAGEGVNAVDPQCDDEEAECVGYSCHRVAEVNAEGWPAIGKLSGPASSRLLRSSSPSHLLLAGPYSALMDSPRVACVRDAYAKFNDGDIDGVMNYFDSDIEYPDPMHDTTVIGSNEVRLHLERQFQDAVRTALPLEVTEIGDAVFVVAFHRAYERRGTPVGPGITAVQRLTFRGDRIARVEFTARDEIPQESRERFG